MTTTTDLQEMARETAEAVRNASKAAKAALAANDADGIAYATAAIKCSNWKAATDSNREAAALLKVNKDTVANYALAASVCRKDPKGHGNAAALRTAINNAVRGKVGREAIGTAIDGTDTVTAAIAAVRALRKAGMGDGETDGETEGGTEVRKPTLKGALKRMLKGLDDASIADMESLDDEMLAALLAAPAKLSALLESINLQRQAARK